MVTTTQARISRDVVLDKERDTMQLSEINLKCNLAVEARLMRVETLWTYSFRPRLVVLLSDLRKLFDRGDIDDSSKL